MEQAIFCVLENRDGWMVRLNGKAFGPARSRAEAVGAAARAGSRAHGMGLHAQIVVKEGTVLRSVWVNGRLLAPNVV